MSTTIPNNSDEMFEEITEFTKSLPHPHNELFLIELYKLYIQQKMDYLVATIITAYEEKLEQTMESFNGPANKLKTKG